MQPRGDREVVISFRIEHLLGWGVTIILCLIPAIIWLTIHPLAQIHGFPAIMLSLGRVTGLIGIVMYSLNLVYSTRLRFLERFFGGLNRVYIAHHLLGGLSLVLLSFHPIFLSLRYVKPAIKQSPILLKQAALLLLPNGLTPIHDLLNTHGTFHSIVLEQWAITFGIIAFWGMVVLLLVTFFIQIPYRLWLFTHKFLGAAFFFGSLHILFITSDTSTHPILKDYILIIVAIGLLAYTYRTLMGKILIRRYKYRVETVRQSGGNVTEIGLMPQNLPISYMGGQFIFVRFLGVGKSGVSNEWHPFSISSGTNQKLLQLSIKGLGDFTNTLVKLRPGTEAEVEGAYGRFSYVNYKNPHQIWVAGGIGITPFLSMARSLPETGFAIDLYYSVKTESEIIDWDAFYALAEAKKGQFRVFPFVGEKEKGYLSADYIEAHSQGVTGKEIFICGPPVMMKSMRQQFRAKGVANATIHTEEFAMS